LKTHLARGARQLLQFKPTGRSFKLYRFWRTMIMIMMLTLQRMLAVAHGKPGSGCGSIVYMHDLPACAKMPALPVNGGVQKCPTLLQPPFKPHKTLFCGSCSSEKNLELVQRFVTVTTQPHGVLLTARRSIEQWHIYISSGSERTQQQEQQQHWQRSPATLIWKAWKQHKNEQHQHQQRLPDGK